MREITYSQNGEYQIPDISLNNLLPCKYSSINQIRKSLMVCQIFLHSLVFSPKGLHLLSLYTTYRNLLPNGIRKIQSS